MLKYDVSIHLRFLRFANEPGNVWMKLYDNDNNSKLMISPIHET